MVEENRVDIKARVWLNSPAMSRMCEICGKGRLRGKLVPRLIGRRVSHRSIHLQQVNLREKKLDLGGRLVRVKLCTTCLSLYNNAKKSLA
jgi:ribosomal protein L28